MASWSYRKRVTIAPGVRLNISKKGISTTFGVRGASINVGQNGAYLNTGIPGTGIYKRQKIGGSGDRTDSSSQTAMNSDNYIIPDKPNANNGCITGAIIASLIGIIGGYSLLDHEELKFVGVLSLIAAGFFFIILIVSTIHRLMKNSSYAKTKRDEKMYQSLLDSINFAISQTTEPMKIEILQNYRTCLEMNKKYDEIEAVIEALKEKTEKNPKLKEQLEKHETELLNLTNELNEVQLDSDRDLDDVEKWKYSAFCESFEKILSCKKIWLITSSERNTVLKSSAATTVERKEISFDTGVFNYIKSSFNIPMLRDLSGSIYYIYPRYIINAQSVIDFEIFPIDTIDFTCSKRRFIERENLPEDTYTVDYTYQYVNKNGDPDKRYSYNPRYPIVEYGRIEIERFGLTYYVSNYLEADSFVFFFNLWKKQPVSEESALQNYASSASINDTYVKFLINGEIDPLFYDAAKLIVIHQQGSTSLIQRKLCIGYNRAGRLMDQLEKVGIVGPIESNKGRQVLFSDEYTLEAYFKELRLKKTLKEDDLPTSSIDKKYFNTINQAVEKLKDFYGNLESDTNFKTIIENEFTSFEKPETDKTEWLKILFLHDIIKCYTELGHPIDLKSKEGLGLIIFSAQFIGDGKIHSDTPEIYLADSLIQSIENYIKQMTGFFKTYIAQPEEVFFISKFLGQYDIDLQKKYLILLYRFASITSKADGVITEHEEIWLSKLLQLGEVSKTDECLKDKKESKGRKENNVLQKTFLPSNKNPHDELHELIGLDTVKSEIESLENFIRIQQMRETKGLKISQLSYHCVFTGNPGTGKTTVARIVSEIYKELGILKNGHLIETDRSGLVAEYVGQTAVKTNNIVDSALDGVLFIDEAYSLITGSNNDYGKEAIATLLKRMEDNRDRLVVILAGYTTEMREFIFSNPGLQSRFNRYIEFPDYSADELYQIFDFNLNRYDYRLTGNVDDRLREFFQQSVASRDRNFGNARFVRNFFEKTLERQANRLAKETNLTTEKLTEICDNDIFCRV